MAKRGQFAGDPEGARQYLANLIAGDQWSAAKSLDQYQDSQVIRKANAFRQMEQANLPLNNKAARGHADIIPQRPEPLLPPSRRVQPGQVVDRDRRVSPPSPPAGPLIGGRGPTQLPAVPPPAPQARKDVPIFHAPKIPMDVHINGPRNSYQVNTTRFKDVVHELKAIAKAKGLDAKVYFSLWDNRKGDWTKMYVWKGAGAKSANNGVRVGDLLARMSKAQKAGRTARGALIDSWQEDIDGGQAGSTTPGDIGLPSVFTTVGVHLMGS